MEQINNSSGIEPTEQDKKKIHNMTWSYSRLSTFKQCPLKWYYSYLQKVKDERHDHFVTGNTCHKIAEECGKWCHFQKWINSYTAYKRHINSNSESYSFNFDKVRSEAVTMYNDKSRVPEITGRAKFSQLYFEIERYLEENEIEYENPSMPPMQEFIDIMTRAKTKYGCLDPKMVKDVDIIMWRFFKTHDFTQLIGELSLFERKMAIDKRGNKVGFFDDEAYIRGVADVIDFYDNALIITDYKSSRTMISEDDMSRDMQTKLYVYLVLKTLGITPGESDIENVVMTIDYIRFNQQVSMELSGADAINRLIHDVEVWIDQSVSEVVEETKKENKAFSPQRNEFCSSCHVADAGLCSLFNKMSDDLSDMDQFIVNSAEDCMKAWKRIERNKMENTRLSKECKGFLKNTSNPVYIDSGCKLDLYTKEDCKYRVPALIEELKSHNIELEKVYDYLSINKENLGKMMKSLGVTLNKEKMDEISKMFKKSEFKALTKKEAERKGYLNA